MFFGLFVVLLFQVFPFMFFFQGFSRFFLGFSRVLVFFCFLFRRISCAFGLTSSSLPSRTACVLLASQPGKPGQQAMAEEFQKASRKLVFLTPKTSKNSDLWCVFCLSWWFSPVSCLLFLFFSKKWVVYSL